MLRRRGLLLGLGTLLVTPAIVRAESLMPISAPKSTYWKSLGVYLTEFDYTDQTLKVNLWDKYSGRSRPIDVTKPWYISAGLHRPLAWSQTPFSQPVPTALDRVNEKRLLMTLQQITGTPVSKTEAPQILDYLDRLEDRKNVAS